MRRLMAVAAAGRIDTRPMVTACFALDDIETDNDPLSHL